MNWFKWIPVLWKTRSVIEEDLKEGKAMDGAKPGWKTSTFWIKVFTVDAPVLYAAIRGFLPPKSAAYIEVAALGIFAIYRTVIGVTKQVQAIKTGQPAEPVSVAPAA